MVDGASGLGVVVALSTGLAACGSSGGSKTATAAKGATTKALQKVNVAYTASPFPSIVNNRAGLL
jgi:hypothetical protein